MSGKTFDGLLREAYNAGYEDMGAPPAFEEWRATIAGNDEEDNLGPIRVGDTVEVISTDPLFEQVRGARSKVERLDGQYAYLRVDVTMWAGGLRAIHLDGVRKVRP